MMRMVSTLLLVLLLAIGTGQSFGADDTADPPVEISEEDREIAEMMELLELLELLSEMEDVAALEESP